MKRLEAIDAVNKVTAILGASPNNRILFLQDADVGGMVCDVLRARAMLDDIINRLINEGIQD